MNKKIVGILVMTLLIITSTLVVADWDVGDDHKMHWPQLPDLSSNGLDLCMKGDVHPYASFADDFFCYESGLVTEIHFWGSFEVDILPPGGAGSLTFQIIIHEDNNKKPGFSLWEKTFSPGEYLVRLYDEGWQGWYCPWTGWFNLNNHRKTYQYNFFIDEELAFYQTITDVYWLEVRWIHGEADYAFGWKTTRSQDRWKESAYSFDGTNWQPLLYPSGHQNFNEKINLAFVIGGGLGDMELSSDAFENNGIIPEIYTAVPNIGDWGISPPLIITNIPTNTVSLALIMNDTDAFDDMGEFWVHWIVYNIPSPQPATPTLLILENAGAEGGALLPGDAVHGSNTVNQQFYLGPCPPSGNGDHHYNFTVFALDTILDLNPGTNRTNLIREMRNHIISEASLVGIYRNDNRPPDTPTCIYDRNNDELVFSSDDPDGDQICYIFIDNSGQQAHITEYYNTGVIVRFDCQGQSSQFIGWRLFAEDIHGDSSDWIDIRSKNKLFYIHSLFMKFLNDYPYLSLILQQILGK